MPSRIPFLKLPASQPRIAREYQRRVARVIRRARFILGDEVAGFEAAFARFCGARECVGVANGTEALVIALRLSGIQPGRGQEVITTPLTAAFTGHAIVAAGARPVFADIDPDTLLLDPEAVRRRITSRTAAIIPVHLYGHCCDLGAFRRLARRQGCALIQDAAQAHGSDYRARPLADFSEWVAFSFYPTKNLGALGDAGALVTRRPALAQQARRFRDGGRSAGGRGGSHVARTEGINSRLDELQAVLLRVHLHYLKSWNRRREALARRYDRLLAPLVPEYLKTLPRLTHGRSANHLYVIRASRRDALREYLLRRGIETGLHYEQPLHLQPAFRKLGFRLGDFPHAEKAAREILSLPLYPFLPGRDVDRIVEEITRFYRR